MQLSIIEIQKVMPIVFDCKCYDTILECCKMLFSKQSVTTSDREIFIKDKITLRLSLSNNEQKIYFTTYILPEKTIQAMTLKEINVNYSFRLFNLDEMVNYLMIKYQENEFIKQNEG